MDEFKGTVIHIKNAIINDRLHVSKVPGRFPVPTISNFAVKVVIF